MLGASKHETASILTPLTHWASQGPDSCGSSLPLLIGDTNIFIDFEEGELISELFQISGNPSAACAVSVYRGCRRGIIKRFVTKW
jgi:hypothetical protein